MYSGSLSDQIGAYWFLLKGRHNSSYRLKAVFLTENEQALKEIQTGRSEGWDHSFCWTEVDTSGHKAVLFIFCPTHSVLHCPLLNLSRNVKHQLQWWPCCPYPPHLSGARAVRSVEDDHKASFTPIQLGRIWGCYHRSECWFFWWK